MSVWVMPMTAPITIDAPAITPSTGCQVQAIGSSATWQTRSIAANAATLVQDGHERRDRGRRPLVDVRRPQVERADRGLEQQADDTSAIPPSSSTSLLSPALAWAAIAANDVEPA